MKSIVAILFSLTMLLQAIPLFHFFSDRPEIFYVAIDEEKPGEKTKDTKEDKQDDKSLLNQSFCRTVELQFHCNFISQGRSIPVSPYLEKHTPPPNAG